MKQSEVRSFCRFLLDDKEGTLILDSDLTPLIRMAIDKVISEIKKLDEDYFIQTAPLATVANTRSYAFSAIASDIDKIWMVEKNLSPKYPKLNSLDWLKHKHEFTTTGEPENFYSIGKKLYLLRVADAVYNYTVYYDPEATYPSNDDTELPLIPAKYHDLVGIWTAVLANQTLSHYSKQGALSQTLIGLLNERKVDLYQEFGGKRIEKVEVSQGVTGGEVEKAQGAA